MRAFFFVLLMIKSSISRKLSSTPCSYISVWLRFVIKKKNKTLLILWRPGLSNLYQLILVLYTFYSFHCNQIWPHFLQTSLQFCCKEGVLFTSVFVFKVSKAQRKLFDLMCFTSVDCFWSCKSII